MLRPEAIEQAVKNRRKLERQELAEFGRLARLYGGLSSSLEELLEAVAAEVVNLKSVSLYQLQRLPGFRRLLAQARSELARFGGAIRDSVAIVQQQAIQDALRDAIGLIGSSLPPLPDDATRQVITALTTPSPDEVSAAIEPIAETQPDDDYANAVSEQVEKHLFDGLASGGESETGVLRSLKRNLQGALGVGLTWALQTVRTAMVKVYQAATQLVYMANNNLVPRWVWWAKLDETTCLSCVNQHGSEHPVTERLNDHRSGRCIAIPKAIVYEDLGIRVTVQDERLERIERGEDWFKRQSRTTQRQMMGQARHDAWRAGEFDFRDLSQPYDDPVYGELLREASLKGLIGEKAKEYYKHG